MTHNKHNLNCHHHDLNLTIAIVFWKCWVTLYILTLTLPHPILVGKADPPHVWGGPEPLVCRMILIGL